MPSTLSWDVKDLERLRYAVAGTADKVGAVLDSVTVAGSAIVELRGVEGKAIPRLVTCKELAESGACIAGDVVAVARWRGLVRSGSDGCSHGDSGRCACRGAGGDRNTRRLSGHASCAGGRDRRCRLERREISKGPSDIARRANNLLCWSGASRRVSMLA